MGSALSSAGNPARDGDLISSKSPFNKYKTDLSPVQVKVVQDYIARIRTQMVQVLKSQEISIPPPEFEARRSIRVNLEFADISPSKKLELLLCFW
jgi:hypothetical protein